jgi:septation ring formation regulator EzrA
MSDNTQRSRAVMVPLDSDANRFDNNNQYQGSSEELAQTLEKVVS